MAELDVNLGSGSGEPTESEAPTHLVFWSRKYGFRVYEQRKTWFIEGKKGRGPLHTDPSEVVDVIAVVFNERIAKRLAKKLNVEWVGIDV